MRSIGEIRIRTGQKVLPAMTGLALGCTLAYWVASSRGGKPRVRKSRPIEHAGPALEPLGDDLIVELVRSEITRCCSHPESIKVTCAKGVVRLEGPVLKSEITRVLRCVSRIPGIEEIHDRLEAHRLPLGIAGLNGAGRRPRRRALQPM